MSENEHSRTIKLRAWDISGEQMIYLEGPTKLSYSMGDGFKLVFGAGFHDDLCDGHVAAFDLMQFTGLTDCNGKDIYEGDIVRHRKWPSSPFEVKWCDGKGEMLGNQLGWVLDDSQFCSGEHLVPLEAYLHWSETSKEEYGDMEVIGNIYENPELVAPINN